MKTTFFNKINNREAYTALSPALETARGEAASLMPEKSVQGFQMFASTLSCQFHTFQNVGTPGNTL